MSTSSLSTRQPWFDRWSKPSLPQLLDPLKAHHRRQFVTLIQQLGANDKLQQSIIWFGPSWKWTIHLTMAPAAKTGSSAKVGKAETSRSTRAASAAPIEVVNGQPEYDDLTLCYLVPNLDAPLVCVPLSDTLIQSLPKKRMSKFINEGIRSSKCAVKTHWAIWSPATEAETLLLLDLLTRKLDLHTGQTPNPRKSSASKSTAAKAGATRTDAPQADSTKLAASSSKTSKPEATKPVKTQSTAPKAAKTQSATAKPAKTPSSPPKPARTQSPAAKTVAAKSPASQSTGTRTTGVKSSSSKTLSSKSLGTKSLGSKPLGAKSPAKKSA